MFYNSFINFTVAPPPLRVVENILCRFTNEVQNHSLTPWGKRSRKEEKVV